MFVTPLALQAADKDKDLLAERVAALEAALAQEVSDRQTADIAIESALLETMCRMIQAMPGNPPDAFISVCGDRLFKTVFVTSTTHLGDLKTAGGGTTGLERADKICNARAQEAGLPGTYSAWLSDTTTSARDRVTLSTVPFVRTDGVRVADDFDNLSDSSIFGLQAPIEIDEHSTVIFDGEYVWTNTAPDGSLGTTSPAGTCHDWTTSEFGPGLNGLAGLATTTGAAWTLGPASSRTCSIPRRLYCFQD